VCPFRQSLAYRPRLFFYLEEVEELQDAAVFAGSKINAELEKKKKMRSKIYFSESEEPGLRGRLMLGALVTATILTSISGVVPVETRSISRRLVKRSFTNPFAYFHLTTLSHCCRKEGRICYHADNVLVHVPFDDEGTPPFPMHQQARSPVRLPTSSLVTDNERLCACCSLGLVCLPEEA